MWTVSNIYLYDEPNAPGLDIDEIGGFLAAQFPGVDVQTRRDYLTHQFGRFPQDQRTVLEQEAARQFEAARLATLPRDDDADDEEAEVDVVLEARLHQAVLRLLVDAEEASADHLHIAFTSLAIGSSEADEGYRQHVLCMGEPSVISIVGMTEALPPPREYVFRRAQFAIFGVDDEALEELADDFADRTFGYADPRINEVCKGYALMACFYRMFGEAFCDEPDCRLWPAATQEELIEVQCGPAAGLCDRHELMRLEVAAGA